MEKEGLYELMFDQARDAKFLIDVDHASDPISFRYIRVNEAYAERTGLGNNTLAGHTPGELFEPELAEAFRDNYRRCVREEHPIRYIETVPLPDGSGRWKTVLTPLMDQGRVEAIQGMTRDVTGEKSHRKELQFFREAIGQHPDEFYFVDPDTACFTGSTELVSSLLGYTEQELLSLRVHDINLHIGRTIDWADHVEKLKNEGDKQFETVNIRKDGTLFPARVHNDFVQVNGTERIVASIRDITEQKQRERQIRDRKKLKDIISRDPFTTSRN